MDMLNAPNDNHPQEISVAYGTTIQNVLIPSILPVESAGF